MDLSRALFDAEARLARSLGELAATSLSPAVLLALDCPLPGGSRPKLFALASVAKVDARSCVATAHDPRDASAVAKALESSALGLSIRREGPSCHVRLPAPSAEARERLAARAAALEQEALGAIRLARKNFLAHPGTAPAPGRGADASALIRSRGEATRIKAQERCAKLAADARLRILSMGGGSR